MQQKTIESGVQLFSRISHRTDLNGINPKLFPNGGPHQNEIIEVVGENRNRLLLDVIIRSILPTELNETWRNCGVVFMNMNHEITLLKITKIMDNYLKELNINNRQNVIEKALKNLVILNCYDIEEMQLTFYNLERIVQNQKNISLLAIDNLNSQYWIAKQNDNKLSLTNYLKTNLRLLKRIIKDLNLVLIYSRENTKNITLEVDYKIISYENDIVENIYLNN